jgi:hypothetical protein
VKPQLAVYAFVAFFAILGGAALVVGAHDVAITSGSIGLTALSVLLIGVGIVLIVAAYELVKLKRRSDLIEGERPRSRSIVLAALLSTIFVGVYLFFAAIRTSGTQHLVVVVTALVVIVIAALGLRYFGRGVRMTTRRVEGAIAVGVLGIVLGVSQFWFQNEYVPAHAGRAVVLKTYLTRAGEQSGYDVISARIDYEAVGGRSVSTIGSAYTLAASHVVRCHRAATAGRVRDFFHGFLLDPQVSRYMTDVREERPAALLATGKFVGDGKRLDPNVPFSREFIFFVPRHRYQLLRFRAQLLSIPASVRLSRRAYPKYITYPPDNEVYGYWQVIDDSWLHDLLYGRERWVVIRYDLVNPDRPTVATTADAVWIRARFPNPTWHQQRPSKSLVYRLFFQPDFTDSSIPFSASELPLENVTQPTSKDPSICRGGS